MILLYDIEHDDHNHQKCHLRQAVITCKNVASQIWLMILIRLKNSLQKSLYTQQKNLSSLTRNCNLPIFTANETITKLTQYELSQEESDLLKAALYFSI